MNGIHSSKMGEMWLIILKLKIARWEVGMTKNVEKVRRNSGGESEGDY